MKRFLKGKDSDDDDEDSQSRRAGSTRTNSLFSNHGTIDTFSTNPSTSRSNKKRQDSQRLDLVNEDEEQGFGFLSGDIGRPLRVVNADKYSEMSRKGREAEEEVEILNQSQVLAEFTLLNENVLELVDRLGQNMVNVSKTTMSLVELLDHCFRNKRLEQCQEDQLKPEINKLLKALLQFHDFYLRTDVYLSLKKLLIRKLVEFLKELNIELEYGPNETVPFISNFAIVETKESDPNVSLVERILEKISMSNSSIISDQPGAFIAPIMRGLTHGTSVLSIMFGLPEPQSEHYDVINALIEKFPEVHFFVVKNFIQLCHSDKVMKFKPPFKVPDKKSPEISISVSSSSSLKTSGTLGGYLKPIIPSGLKNNALLKYKNSKFGITCAHVLINDETYPKVSVPSKPMVNSYRSALLDERDKFSKSSIEYKSFDLEIGNCDKYEIELGQVIWGERILIQNKISDIAIVKVNDSLKSENSFITNKQDDSLPLHLTFQNSRIVKWIPKSQFPSHHRIFKIGSATGHTTGEINGLKLVYWLDGHLQTSEFVVSAKEPLFANGGDSGSLILNDLQDKRGLGCIGMLHSFDGEMKQLGLFSAMEDILLRLKDVTGIEWELV